VLLFSYTQSIDHAEELKRRTSFVTCDGEAIQLNAIMKPNVLAALADANIDVSMILTLRMLLNTVKSLINMLVYTLNRSVNCRRPPAAPLRRVT